MKKVIIFLTLAVGFLSCQKDSLLPSKITAFINGDTWKSLTQVAVKQNGIITITGTDASGRIIVIAIHGITKGTYTLSLQSAECSCTYTASPTNVSDVYESLTGTVTLTTVTSSSISGTFDFECKNTSLTTKSITNGQFTGVNLTSY